MGAAVDWSWPLAVLAVGLVLGLVLATRLSARARPAPAGPSLERRDLEGKRQALLVQLRELEDTAVKRTPAQLARERYALELETAQAWRELERLGTRAGSKEAKAAARAQAAAAAEPAASGVSGRRGFLWGAATATAVAVLAVFLANVIKPRGEGDSVTGNLPMRGQGGPAEAPAEPPLSPEEQQEEKRLREVLAKSPDDHDTRMDLVQLYLAREDLMAVWNETQYILQRVPGHPRALSYAALVRLAMGQGDTAVEMLKQAQAAAPKLLEPSLHLALVYARLGRMKEAEATIAEAQKRHPEQAPRLGQLMAQMRQFGSEPPPQAARAEDAPAEGAPAAPPAGPAAPARGVAGVIEIDPRLAGSVPAGGLVFVTARPAGVTQGPPVAVKRLPASFPLRFELTSADSMMGQPLPDKLRLEARLDADGDPLSRGATDFAARLDDVPVGRVDLKLVLKQ
jgi:tetratricopeptide (TPR) repeat protein